MDRLTTGVAAGVLALVAAGLVTAWALLARSAQERTDRDHYLARVGHDVSRGPGVYLTTEGEQITGDTASVVLVNTYRGSGSIFGDEASSNRTTVRLIRDSSGWRITVPPDDYNLVASQNRKGS